MRIYLLAGLMSVVLLGLVVAAVSRRGTRVGSASPQSPTFETVARPAKPVLVSRPATVTLGLKPRTVEAKAELVLVNTGTEPIRVLDVDRTCRCTSLSGRANKAITFPMSIAPGKEVPITVTVNTSNRIGAFRETISFVTDKGSQGNLAVDIVGSVEGYFAMPEIVALSRSAVGSPAATDLEIHQVGGKVIAPKFAVSTTTQVLTVTPRAISPPEPSSTPTRTVLAELSRVVARVALSVNPEKVEKGRDIFETGTYKDIVKFTFDGKPRATVEVPVTVSVHPAVEFIPSRLLLEIGSPREGDAPALSGQFRVLADDASTRVRLKKVPIHAELRHKGVTLQPGDELSLGQAFELRYAPPGTLTTSNGIGSERVELEVHYKNTIQVRPYKFLYRSDRGGAGGP